MINDSQLSFSLPCVSRNKLLLHARIEAGHIDHDPLVRAVAGRVAIMYLGKIVELADKRSLFARPRHPYTQALLSAIRLPEPALKRQRVILQGDVPSLFDPPSGCRFHTRCPHARERCRTEEPVLEANGSAEAHRTACHFWREIEIAEALPPGSQCGATPTSPSCKSFSGDRAIPWRSQRKRRAGDTMLLD